MPRAKKRKQIASSKSNSKENGSSDGVMKTQIKKRRRPSDDSLLIEPADSESVALVARKASNVKTVVNTQKEQLLIGCHVSAAGGVHNSIANADSQKARAFAMFLTNQRTWNSKPLDDDVIQKFKESLSNSNIDINAIVPHGIYLMNCASPDPVLLSKSRAKLLEEIERCEKLGIRLYNLHPGSTVGKITRTEAIANIVDSLNGVLDTTTGVTLLIENMSGQKNTIGSKFEELRAIIDGIRNKDRIGVCLDTCHAFAAGFDLRTPEAYKETVSKFDEIIGLKYLKAIHLNDSVADLGSHLDRHADIGTGKIGKNGFRNLVNDPRMVNIPMILETPGFKDYDKQIDLLYSLVDA